MMKLYLFIFALISSQYFAIDCVQEDEDPNDLYFDFIPSSREYKISVRLDEPELLLQQDGFNVSRKTVMYAGGVHQIDNLQLLNEIIDNYLAIGTYNVIQLDYNALSEKSNSSVMSQNLYEFCKKYADAILKLVDAGLPASSIELVGHSVGADVIGLIGRYTQSKLGLIVGLDPPNPYNETLFDKGYAQFTIAVWTDRGFVSDANVTADADYMVNNGTVVQPGCPDGLIAHFCGHLRAVDIWANIILYPELFIGLPCNETYCDHNATVQLGPETRLYGQYFFRTNATAPFGYGPDGAER